MNHSMFGLDCGGFTGRAHGDKKLNIERSATKESMMNTTFKVVCSFALLSSSQAFAADYPAGYVWDRSTQWVAGATPGSDAGNPGSDGLGNAVWRYEWTTGGSAGSASPWYLGEKHLMVWDDEWWGANGQSNWARGYLGPGSDNNVNPPIGRYTMAHDLSLYKQSWDYMPVSRWINPVGDGTIVDLSGSIAIEWAGWGVSPDVDVDVILGLKDASENSFSLLLSETVSNPTPGLVNPPYPRVTVPVSFSSVRFDEGDSLLISLRAQVSPFTLPNWVVLYDDVRIKYITTVTAVPEPQAVVLLMVGMSILGFVAWNRRDRVLLMQSRSITQPRC